MPQPASSSTALNKASLNARRGHWQSNERPIILFDWPRRRTSAPRREICCLFQSMRLKLGSRGTECEALREAISIEKRYIGERKSLLILVPFEGIARLPSRAAAI